MKILKTHVETHTQSDMHVFGVTLSHIVLSHTNTESHTHTHTPTHTHTRRSIISLVFTLTSQRAALINPFLSQVSNAPRYMTVESD